MMSYRLFLDDLRSPPDESWVVVRSVDAAIDCVEANGMPSEISFDHDLGEDRDAMNFVNWLISSHLDRKHVFLPDFVYAVHSMNPVGKQNIINKMNAFLAFVRENDDGT